MKKLASALFVFVVASFSPCLAENSLKDMLGLFITISEKDSVAEVTDADSVLQVKIVNTESKESRLENAPVNAVQKAKILAAYKERATAPVAAPEQKAAEAPAVAKDISAQRKNHLTYVTWQTSMSYYVYSLVWPIGFEASGTTSTALSLITIPAFFGTHYFIQKKYAFHDAEISGINYLTADFLALTYSVPFAFTSDDALNDAFKISAIASMVTYPMGIYYGYKLGERNEANPGRIDMESLGAASGYVLGLTSPMIYLGESIGNDSWRPLMFGSAIAFSIGGHFFGKAYQKDAYIPRGNPSGIGSFGLLGLLTGLTFDSWIEPHNVNSAVAIPWFGYVGGFCVGMKVFQNRRDLWERGEYNGLGMAGGVMAAMGVLVLAKPESFAGIMTPLTLGAYGGYFLTDFLTRDLVESNDAKAARTLPVEFNFTFAPEVKSKRFLDGKRYTEYSVAPITVKF